MLNWLFGRLEDGFIVVECSAGLGNRLLTLEGAILLGRELGKRVYLGWPETGQCRCRFGDLFELPNSNFEVLRHPAKDVNMVYRLVPRVVARLHGGAGLWMNGAWRKLLLRHRYGFDASVKPYRAYRRGWYGGREIVGMEEMRVLKERKRIYLNAYFNVHEDLNPGGPERRYDYLRPTAELRQRVDEIAGQFGGSTVGVHIRQGDEGWERRSHSPLSEFVRLMREEVMRDDGVRFYLSTESSSVVSRLRVLFGDRIIVQRDAALERGSVAGMKSAVVDLWALGRTRRILGSFWSSFPRVASRLELAELHTVDVLKPGFKAERGGG